MRSISFLGFLAAALGTAGLSVAERPVASAAPVRNRSLPGKTIKVKGTFSGKTRNTQTSLQYMSAISRNQPSFVTPVDIGGHGRKRNRNAKARAKNLAWKR